MTQRVREEAQLRADLAVLRHGISAEALAVLKRRYGFEVPLFGNDVVTSSDSNDRFLRTALIKEGQRQVISFINLSHSTNHV
jgi:hypothetical protein